VTGWVWDLITVVYAWVTTERTPIVPEEVPTRRERPSRERAQEVTGWEWAASSK